MTPEPSPEPAPDLASLDIPQWIKDLVPTALRVRVLLFSQPLLALAAWVLIVATPWLPRISEPGRLDASLAFVAGGVGSWLALRYAGPAGQERADALAVARAAAGKDGAWAASPLPRGGHAVAFILTADLLLTACGLLAWAGVAVAGAPDALRAGALVAAVGLCVALLVALMAWSGLEWLTSGGHLGMVAGVLTAVAACAAQELGGAGAGLWWFIAGCVVTLDVAGLLVIRAARRQDVQA